MKPSICRYCGELYLSIDNICPPCKEDRKRWLQEHRREMDGLRKAFSEPEMDDEYSARLIEGFEIMDEDYWE